MPRARKKLTPEELKAQFDAWKESSEEYKLVDQLRDIKNNTGLSEISETTQDLVEKWQAFFDLFVKVGTVFKVRGAKLKPILQEQIRTSFFGAVSKRDEPFWIDDFQLDYAEKDIPKNCRNVRNMMIEFMKFVDEIDTITETDYNEWKKSKISAKFKDFVKFFKEHIKKDKGHTTTKKMMLEVLAPLEELMDANMRLTLFDIKHETELKYEQNNFKYLALIQKWCTTYQRCQTVLNTHNPSIIRCNPDIYSIQKKIQYVGWRTNKIENFYIKPLLDSLQRQKVNLTKIYSMGFDFWKQPLSENKQFVKDIEEMIKREQTSEMIMGNKLTRFQQNFLYDTIGIVYNSPSKAKLLTKAEKIVEKTIPELAILKGFEQMHKVFCIKLNELHEKKDFDHYQIQSPPNIIDFALMSALDPNGERSHQALLPYGVEYSEKFLLVNGVEIEVVINDNDQEELEKYERYFVWVNLLPKDKHKEMITASKLLRNINKAVIQDLEDYIIAQGMEPLPGDYKKNRDQAKEDMALLAKMQEEEKEKKVFEFRPPNLWNEPTSQDQKHEFKCSANPFKIYNDSRVRDLYSVIETLSQVLKTNESALWGNLVTRVIDVYKSEEEALNDSNM